MNNLLTPSSFLTLGDEETPSRSPRGEKMSAQRNRPFCVRRLWGGTDPLSHVVLDNIMEGVHKANEDHEEITAANNLKTYGTWDLLEVRDIDQLENEIKNDSVYDL